MCQDEDRKETKDESFLFVLDQASDLRAKALHGALVSFLLEHTRTNICFGFNLRLRLGT